ncbi:uncharacterized protein METZ01_LOCUS437657, partial [marine metagenome]
LCGAAGHGAEPKRVRGHAGRRAGRLLRSPLRADCVPPRQL